MLKRTILLFVGLQLGFCTSQTALAQEGDCTKPRVAVKLANFYDETYDILIRQYPPFQTKEYWIEKIKQEMISKLKANSPGVDIFSADSASDYEYIVTYNVAVIGCGGDVKIGDLLTSKEICYWINGILYSHDACGLAGVGFDGADIKYTDLSSAIAFFALKLGNLATVIDEHERTRPIPPRGPRMRTNVEPKSVSPLEGERELTIKASITNCKGEPVCDKVGERYGVLAGPKETKRGTTIPTEGNAWMAVGDYWKISPDNAGIASLKYTLERGVSAGKEKINFKACGLGTFVEDSPEIEIEGLDIKISPKGREVSSGEQVRIQIELNKIDNRGMRRPVPGKKIQVTEAGLVDGTVTPAGDVMTDENGRATLTYRAGDQEQKVKFSAKFQPRGFKEAVQDDAEMTVGRGDYAVSIQFSKIWSFDTNNHADHREGEFKGTISGFFQKSKESQYPLEMFEPVGMTVTWTYKDQVIDSKPKSKCLALQSEHAGSGAFPIRLESRMFLTHLMTSGPASQQMAQMGIVDSYNIALGGTQPAQKISGKSLGGSCNTYKDDTAGYPQVGIELKFKMQEDKHLFGSKSWSSRGGEPWTSVDLRCSDLTEKPFNARPFVPDTPGNEFKYTVAWDIKKIKN